MVSTQMASLKFPYRDLLCFLFTLMIYMKQLSIIKYTTLQIILTCWTLIVMYSPLTNKSSFWQLKYFMVKISRWNILVKRPVFMKAGLKTFGNIDNSSWYSHIKTINLNVNVLWLVCLLYTVNWFVGYLNCLIKSFC